MEKIFTRPSENKINGGKAVKIGWMKKLSNIEKNIMKPTYSVPLNDYNFIKEISVWLL